MTKVLVVSDNHGSLHMIKKIINIEKPQYVIHAGDFCVSKSEIESLVDMYVAGNNDYDGKDLEKFSIEEVNILLTHGHQYSSLFNHDKWLERLSNEAIANNCQVVIYGHSHKEEIAKVNGVSIINPGSINYPRNKNRTPSYAILEINRDKMKTNIQYINKSSNWY